MPLRELSSRVRQSTPRPAEARIEQRKELPRPHTPSRPISPLPPSSPPPASSDNVLPHLPFVPTVGETVADELSENPPPTHDATDPFGFLAAEQVIKARHAHHAGPSRACNSQAVRAPITVRPPTPIEDDEDDLYAPPPPVLFASRESSQQPTTSTSRNRKRKLTLTPLRSPSTSLPPTPTQIRPQNTYPPTPKRRRRSKENGPLHEQPTGLPAKLSPKTKRRTQPARKAASTGARRTRKAAKADENVSEDEESPAKREHTRRHIKPSSRKHSNRVHEIKSNADDGGPSFALDDDERESYEQAKSERLAYFKNLDSYKLAEENVYVI